LKAVSQTKEFTDAAKAAAKAPLQFAQNLANDPVAAAKAGTIEVTAKALPGPLK
jgi:hypothetical protein